MPPAKARPIVAELGRPETPEEEAARRSENSRLYRQRKTVNNLIFSLLATLGVVAIIFFAVPRADEAPAWQVDYVAVAETAQANVSSAIVVPVLDDTWVANAAEVRIGTDGTQEWRIGFVTPSQGYIGFEQAFGANPAWISARMEGTTPVSTDVIAGITWDVYDNGSAGNNSYALCTTIDGVTFLLRGDAEASEFALLATGMSSAINEGMTK